MESILSYCREYPDLELQDLFKFLYQNCFGCSHFSGTFPVALEQILREAEFAQSDVLPEIEILGEKYARIHLKYLKHGLSPETLCRLFLLSAEEKHATSHLLRKKLEILSAAAADGSVPFSEKDMNTAIQSWEQTGFQPCHHSDSFKQSYHPFYRVIKKEFLPLLPLLLEIDKALHLKPNVSVAIDGRCASGKTTLAAFLEKIYSCNVYHMDDFFLRPEQRTPERLRTPGGNTDHKRFLEEILLPAVNGQKPVYRKYDCHTHTLGPEVTVEPHPLLVTEGSYSLHPALSGYYDIKVFLDIEPDLQRQRILLRNKNTAERFFQEWIPLEERYFESFDIRRHSDLTLVLS